MYDETFIKQLIGRIEELEQKMSERERQQITFPLDYESLPAVAQFFVKKTSADTPQGPVKYAGLENTTLISQKTTAGVFRTVLSLGEETVDKQGGSTSSVNTQFYIENNPSSATFDSFVYSFRKPLYISASGTTVSVVSAANTTTDSTRSWTVNELAGAMINIYNSSGVFQFSRQIASNTATVITIDGTWPSSVSGGTYFILVPTYLGAAEFPWRRLLVGGDDVSSGGDGTVRRAVRLGYGTTGGTETIGIFFGTGSPESVVTANAGSLFLRTNGGASTSLYVKESGTGNTGWIAK